MATSVSTVGLRSAGVLLGAQVGVTPLRKWQMGLLAGRELCHAELGPQDYGAAFSPQLGPKSMSLPPGYGPDFSRYPSSFELLGLTTFYLDPKAPTKALLFMDH